MGCRGVSGAGPMASVEELWLHWSRPLHSSPLADRARRSALSRGCPMALDAASALSPGYHAVPRRCAGSRRRSWTPNTRAVTPTGSSAAACWCRRRRRGSRSWLSCFCCSALLLRGPRARVRRLAEWRRRVVLRALAGSAVHLLLLSLIVYMVQ